jgi:protein involved in polysaccharide export with SLBB domain
MKLLLGFRVRPRYPGFAAASAFGFLVVLAFASSAAQLQNQQDQQDQNRQYQQDQDKRRPVSVTTSELGRQNLSRVSASAAEVKAVLFKDAGLMVELKRWVAKDATEHGQIISDTDLTNDAIFLRLEEDAQFRAVATTLVQKYGYLVPKMNPDSELAKEQDLLRQERAKWIAQIQEESIQKAHGKAEEELQKTTACDQQTDSNCPVQQNRPSPTGNNGLQPAPGNELYPPSNYPSYPPDQNAPFSPPQGGLSPYDRAQLMQTGEDSGSMNNPLLGLQDQYGAMQGLGSGSGAQSGLNLGSQMNPNGNSSQTTGGMPGVFSGGGNSMDSLGLFGLGMGDVSDLSEYRGNASTMDRFGLSPLTSTQPFRPRNQPRSAPPAPEFVRAASPYNDIPSLYDMYVQAIPRPVEPRRFGAEIFQNGFRDSQLIPMDLPVGPDYVVGPGDGLSIDLWGGVSRRLYRTVDREGRVSLPEVGPVLVSGKSLSDVQQDLQRILRTQFRDESADVSLGRLRTIRVYEVGDVENAGAYDVSALSTPLNALFAAGGPTPRGSLRTLKHYRGNQLVQTVDVYDLLLHGVKADMQRLEDGDTILVPPIGAQVTVEGMVRRPAIYELRDEKNLASVLELAGGLLPTAALRHIEVQRIVVHEKQTMLNLDIPEAAESADVTKQLESFQIQDGDKIRIFPIAPYNQSVVYLEGHVLRPGRYSYRSDMRVTDVISTYKDLLPEPATEYAEIVRLNSPDFHPSVESFNLADALDNPAQAPVLHAMDTVRIFSRFDFQNPPIVSVLGDVRLPGTYRTSGQIRLTDAIHLAGGLEPEAELQDVQVFRYLPDGKSKIFSVNLNEALSGDASENILLQPRDRLLVHKNPNAVLPATVSIEGAVSNPGRYPLTSNMQVADLLRVGGGLKPNADTHQADLTRYQYSNQAALTSQHEPIAISAVLAGDSKSNVSLNNGDVLTIRELPGWNDLGASIRVMGEVKNPGTYGIRPGEKLSSVLQRAGGLQPDAYAYGAVLQRTQVRELQAKAQDAMILRVKDAQSSLQNLPASGDPQKDQAREMALEQWQQTLEQLSSNPPIGRVSIRISNNVNHWENTAADIDVRAGDTLIIPKKPSYVMVSGQVYNPTAISYRPGMSAKWYLSQSGGPTQLANKKAIFVIRADGSVISNSDGLWAGESLKGTLQSGDTVVVPEKALGGTIQWQNLFLAAQTAASVATAIVVSVHY